MSGGQRRKPRPVRNPLLLIAGMQAIGRRDADRLLLPFLAHLYEVKHGHGYGESIRLITVHMAAVFDAARHYKLPGLLAAVESAGDAWLEAGQRCSDAGITDRVVLNGDEMRKVDRLAAALDSVLPAFEIGVWSSFIDSGRRRWGKFVADSVFAAAA